jgi:hypothetical protein
MELIVENSKNNLALQFQLLTPEDKTVLFTELIDNENISILSLLSDELIDDLVNSPEKLINKLVLLCCKINKCGKFIRIFIGKILNKLVDNPKIPEWDADTEIYNNHIKYMNYDTCVKYFKAGKQLKIFKIAFHHNYSICDELLTDENVEEHVKSTFTDFENDKTMDNSIHFFRSLSKKTLKYFIDFSTINTINKYNLHGILCSKHITLVDLINLNKKNSLEKLFHTQVISYTIQKINLLVINYIASLGKMKLTENNLLSLVTITSEKTKDCIFTILNNLHDTMFSQHLEIIKQIATNIFPLMTAKDMFTVSQTILDNPELFEIYKANVPPFMVLSKLPTYTVEDLCEAFKNTKLNEKDHKKSFDYIFVPSLLETYLDTEELQTILKNTTKVPLKKLIISQIVNSCKRLTKQTLLQFDNIFPIVINQIYSNFLSQRLPKLVVDSIDMRSLKLSKDEILNMCLVKEDYECGLCYTNSMTKICKSCGHGFCTDCEKINKKEDCSYCRGVFDYIEIRS